MAVEPLSLANVQGDILFGMPKQSEAFFFFSIDQVDGFRTNLADLVPMITSAEDTKTNISEIRTLKLASGKEVDEGDGEVPHPDVVTVSGVNIAFSAKGLEKMSITEDLKDSLFANGMRADAQNLGDLGETSDDGFKPDWDETFLNEIHGVALITGNNATFMNTALDDVKSVLGDTVKEINTITGEVRPDENKGHEHFGYQDGVSNPAIEDVESFKPGQRVIDQGIALFGRGKDADAGRPDWALDGSLMAFRKLPQLVPEFDKFLLDTAGSQEAADLMGARFVGRWKSGAPIVKALTEDDPELGQDSQRNNDFTFERNNQSACPFSAHIRKMVPRGDLGEPTVKDHMILRRGIPFGSEVSEAERSSGTTSQERGLLFVCYQTDLNKGFSFLQKAWANNPNFINPNTGFDPLIGQTVSGGERNMTGAFAAEPEKPLTLLSQWVNSKGGEYFFSPSIPTLKNVFATGMSIQ